MLTSTGLYVHRMCRQKTLNNFNMEVLFMIGIMPVVPVMPRVVPFVLPPGFPAAMWLVMASLILGLATFALLIIILIKISGGD